MHAYIGSCLPSHEGRQARGRKANEKRGEPFGCCTLFKRDFSTRCRNVIFSLPRDTHVHKCRHMGVSCVCVCIYIIRSACVEKKEKEGEKAQSKIRKHVKEEPERKDADLFDKGEDHVERYTKSRYHIRTSLRTRVSNKLTYIHGNMCH